MNEQGIDCQKVLFPCFIKQVGLVTLKVLVVVLYQAESLVDLAGTWCRSCTEVLLGVVLRGSQSLPTCCSDVLKAAHSTGMTTQLNPQTMLHLQQPWCYFWLVRCERCSPLLSLEGNSFGAGLAFISVFSVGCTSRVSLMKLEKGVWVWTRWNYWSENRNFYSLSGAVTNVKQWIKNCKLILHVTN